MFVQFYHVQEENTPSPYVGVIDLSEIGDDNGDDATDVAGTPASPFPNGRYRVPTKGLVQLMVYNPEQTGIKLFVVPYDFRKMPAHTHTFLRQRTVTDPARSAAAAAAAAAAASVSNSMARSAAPAGGGRGASVHTPGSAAMHADPITHAGPSKLVYAVHLRFASTTKGRIFLHKEIQVLFPHRAPDSTTKLETVTEGPENPKFIQTSPAKERARPAPPLQSAERLDSVPHPQIPARAAAAGAGVGAGAGAGAGEVGGC